MGIFLKIDDQNLKFSVTDMDAAAGFHSDGEEFKVLRRGNRAQSEGKLQFKVSFVLKLLLNIRYGLKNSRCTIDHNLESQLYFI